MGEFRRPIAGRRDFLIKAQAACFRSESVTIRADSRRLPARLGRQRCFFGAFRLLTEP